MNREQQLIHTLLPLMPSNPDTIVGPGDDCAVINIDHPERQMLFKTDAVVEDVHFTLDQGADRIGHKALARCLSDIAAMGGTPHSAVVTLGLHKDFDTDWIQRFYEGMGTLARAHEVAIVGGETVRTPSGMFASIALTGWIPTGQAALRRHGKVRDALFVTGLLGGSLKEKHLDFTPRLKEGQWLVSQFGVQTMMDLSDGLAGDLQLLCQASGVGAQLWGDYIPISREAKERARQGDTAKPALVAALTDGEDFELLFAIAPQKAVQLKDAWKEAFPDVPLSCIGTLTEGTEVYLRDRNGIRPLRHHGYDHFQNA